jgi:protein CpxP
MMKSLQRRLFAAGLVAVLGTSAFAQTTPPATPASGAGHHMRGEHGRPDPARMAEFRAKMEQRMAQRMAEFKQKLQIQPAQESAWNTWTAAMKPTPHQRPDRAEFERLTTPERIDRMHAMRAERNAGMDRRTDATKNFYAVLNTQQRKMFDDASLRFMRHGRHGHHGGPKGGPGGEHGPRAPRG